MLLLHHRKTQLYYRNYTRQYFANWNTESDPEVIQQLHSKARQDAQWILSKVRRRRGGSRQQAAGYTDVAVGALDAVSSFL